MNDSKDNLYRMYVVDITNNTGVRTKYKKEGVIALKELGRTVDSCHITSFQQLPTFSRIEFKTAINLVWNLFPPHNHLFILFLYIFYIYFPFCLLLKNHGIWLIYTVSQFLLNVTKNNSIQLEYKFNGNLKRKKKKLIACQLLFSHTKGIDRFVLHITFCGWFYS